MLRPKLISTHTKAKEKFELTCHQYGVVPQEKLADNSKIFTSAEEITMTLSMFAQIMRFAGVGADHHKGITKRNIRIIMAMACTIMLHAAIHWPAIANTTLGPLAVNHAVFLVNHVPDPRTGLCPADLFTKTRWEQQKLNNLHVWMSRLNVGQNDLRWKEVTSVDSVFNLHDQHGLLA